MIFSLQFSVQAFPYLDSNGRQDIYTVIFSALLPLFTVLSFVMLCPSTMKRIVEEKETGVKVCVCVLYLYVSYKLAPLLCLFYTTPLITCTITKLVITHVSLAALHGG